MEIASLRRASAEEGMRNAPSADRLELRASRVGDGPAVHALVRSCPPLDENSAYCNLLQCAHFTDTCVVAERDGALVGWISAYVPPGEPDTLFVWQVAVAREARGLGLGGRMLDDLLARDACQGVRRLKTTITGDNDASWALFGKLAERLGAPLSQAPWLVEGRELPKGHATEHLVTIGPFAAPAART